VFCNVNHWDLIYIGTNTLDKITAYNSGQDNYIICSGTADSTHLCTAGTYQRNYTASHSKRS